MDWAVIGAFIRQILTIAGTWAVSKGWLDGGMAEQLTGAVLVLGSFVWSFVQKKGAQTALTKAEVSPAQPPTTKLPA
jgi:hypothetical protein